MNLDDIETDIKTKLATDLSAFNLDVRSFPDSIVQFVLTNPNGAVLVRYEGSAYDEPVPNRKQQIVHDRVQDWNISVVTKNLSKEDGHHSIYSILEAIRESLTGYTITGFDDASVMWPISDDFVGETRGRWQYQMIFRFFEPNQEC